MAYQAIATKYFGPGNVRGARVKATADAGSITIGWDHALNVERNHIAAAKALATKLDWKGNYFHGVLADGTNVFVNSDSAPDFVI